MVLIILVTFKAMILPDLVSELVGIEIAVELKHSEASTVPVPAY